MGRQLDWSDIYAFLKAFPLLTRWQLEQKSASHINQSSRGFVVPRCIKKKRNPKAVPSYEIIWKDEHKYFCDIFPDEQLQSYLLENDNNLDSLWTTIEPAESVDRVYPYLIEEFEAEKLAKKKKPKTKRAAKSPSVAKKKSKPSESLNDFSEMQSELEAIVEKKKKSGPKKPEAVRCIEKFLTKEVVKPADDTLMGIPDCDVDADFENIMDLSNLISDIVSRSPTVTRLQGHDLVYADFKDEIQPAELGKNQSLDDIDLMIMKKKANPRHKRVKSLRMELMLSSTPNTKGSAVVVQEKVEGSFFALATDNDVFESSYNALISTPGFAGDSSESSDEL